MSFKWILTIFPLFEFSRLTFHGLQGVSAHLYHVTSKYCPLLYFFFFFDLAPSTWYHDRALSCHSVDVPTSIFLPFQKIAAKQAAARAVMQSFVLPRKSVKKNILAAQAQYQSEFLLFYYFFKTLFSLHVACTLKFLCTLISFRP